MSLRCESQHHQARGGHIEAVCCKEALGMWEKLSHAFGDAILAFGATARHRKKVGQFVDDDEALFVVDYR